MKFHVIKASFDGVAGGAQAVPLEDALREIHNSKGWKDIQELRDAIRRWAGNARPGSVFKTYYSAIVAVPQTSASRRNKTCERCGGDLELGELGIIGDEVSQRVRCSACDTQFLDIWVLGDSVPYDRREVPAADDRVATKKSAEPRSRVGSKPPRTKRSTRKAAKKKKR